MTQVQTLPSSQPTTRTMSQFVKYVFFKLDPEWKGLSPSQAQHVKREFLELLERQQEDIQVRTYSLVGTRADIDFMFWIITDSLLKIQDFHSKILKSSLGRYLSTPYSFIAMFRPSEYFGKTSNDPQPVGSKYLFVYPLTKKREWYSIPFDERRKIMKDHVQIGVKYSSVSIHTAYSFGIDDYEFVLSFETDYPQDFVNLVMELRSSEASKYTAVETPLFTCIASTMDEVLEQLTPGE
jgi:chlorite dismutase